MALTLAKNGRKPGAPMLAKSAPKVSAPKHTTLAAQIDQLADLRSLLRQSVAAEKELTAEVLAGLHRVGADRFEGALAVAFIGTRTQLKVDPQRFLEAVGEQGYSALSVSVTGARAFLGEQDLQAIGELSTATTLRVEPRTKAAEVARP